LNRSGEICINQVTNGGAFEPIKGITSLQGIPGEDPEGLGSSIIGNSVLALIVICQFLSEQAERSGDYRF